MFLWSWWFPFLALCVGLPVLLVFAGLLLLVFIMFKLPRLPAEVDSKRQMRIFLIKNGIFLSYLYIKGKFNGKPFLVNARSATDSWLKAKPSIVPGSSVRSSVRNFDGVKVRFYEPIQREGNDLPGLVFIHGGGFVAGSADAYDPVTRKMAEVIKGVVISVDYRLAPEDHFPVGFDDCMTATKHFFSNCSDFGVDPTRVAICGDSAGGNLTAGLVQELCYKTNESQGMCRPKLQILLYPLLQMFDLQTPSYQKHNAAFGVRGGFLSTTSIAWMAPRYVTGTKDNSLTKALLQGSLRAVASQESSVLNHCLSHKFVPAELKESSYITPSEGEINSTSKDLWEKFKHIVQDNRIMPLYREDLSRLPPAYILTCDFDVLRDDGVMYAERLKMAGVEAVLENYVGALHGLLFFPQFKWGHVARKKFYSYLSEAL